MKKVNTNLLKYITILLALERYGSITRVADALEVTQSALTKGLRKAEGDLGQALFVRHSRGVEPTAAGKIALAHTRIVQKHCVETVNEIDGLRNFPRVLRIGAGASFFGLAFARCDG